MLRPNVELEGMDLEGDEDEAADEGGDDDVNDDATMIVNKDATTTEGNEEDHAREVHDEMKEAHRERMELMAVERGEVAAALAKEESASPAERLEYRLAQSEVFAHFLVGTVAGTE